VYSGLVRQTGPVRLERKENMTRSFFMYARPSRGAFFMPRFQVAVPT
jgi:hypothetical protein